MGRAYPMADQQWVFGAGYMAVITKNLGSMVSKMVGEDKQIQMCGVELTLKTIHEFLSAGQLAFSNDDRKLPDIRQLVFPDRTLVRAGWLWLDPGAYLVTFNEVIEVPPDVMAIARPRSSLLRMGATMETAVWEPGYKGRSQSLLVVHNPNGIRLRRNSRLMQLIFFRLENDADKLYEGVYQGENIGDEDDKSI
jgi:dUTP pyrophosphatase